MMYVQADVLYWKPSEQGLSYTLQKSPHSSSLKEPEFEWDFGLKLGVGYPFSGSDLLLRLTSLQTHADALVHAKSTLLYPLWIHLENTPLVAEQIRMHWRLHLAFLDLLFKKQWPLHEKFQLYPQIGARYAIVRQKFNLGYFGGSFTSENEEDLSMKNKFWGVGPYAGLAMQWHLSPPFSLYTTGAFSTLLGQFYVHEAEDKLKGHVKIFTTRQTFTRIAAIAEASVLLRWQKTWEKSQRRLILQAGWDYVLLVKQNHLARIFNTSYLESPTDLSLMGVEWGAQYCF